MDSEKMELKQRLEQECEEGEYILGFEVVGQVCYAAITNSDKTKVHAQITFLESGKSYHEAECPFAQECPQKILKLLSPPKNKLAQEWRHGCQRTIDFDILWRKLRRGDQVEYTDIEEGTWRLTIHNPKSWEFEETSDTEPKHEFVKAFSKGKLKVSRNGKEISLNSR